RHSLNRSISCISTCGTTTDEPRSTGRSWAAPTSSSGTATIRCWRGRWSCERRPRNCGAAMAGGSGSDRWRRWSTDHQLWIELFVIVNFAGLVVDIFLAPSTNQFRVRSEYIPLFFSGGAAVIVAIAVVRRPLQPAIWSAVGHVVGWLAVTIGLAGVILHLDSQFFYARTIRSLTYAAP